MSRSDTRPAIGLKKAYNAFHEVLRSGTLDDAERTEWIEGYKAFREVFSDFRQGVVEASIAYQESVAQRGAENYMTKNDVVSSMLELAMKVEEEGVNIADAELAKIARKLVVSNVVEKGLGSKVDAPYYRVLSGLMNDESAQYRASGSTQKASEIMTDHIEKTRNAVKSLGLTGAMKMQSEMITQKAESEFTRYQGIVADDVDGARKEEAMAILQGIVATLSNLGKAFQQKALSDLPPAMALEDRGERTVSNIERIEMANGYMASAAQSAGVDLTAIREGEAKSGADDARSGTASPIVSTASISASEDQISGKEKFASERAGTVTAIDGYFQNHSTPPSRDEIQGRADILRVEANAAVLRAVELGEAGDFVGAKQALSDSMKLLEQARDAKMGIELVTIAVEGGVPVLVRDARSCSPELIRGVEASEMQFLNMVRAGLDVADIEGLPNAAKTALLANAASFMKDFHQKVSDFSIDLDKRIPQEKAASKLFEQNMESGIYNVFARQGVPNFGNKLDIAKDFQNLGTEHYNIATVSSLGDKTVIEADVGYRHLTEDQAKEYAAINNDNPEKRPAWFNAMPWWEQALCKKYTPALVDGKHTIPTQLWQLVGMKNAFEKITYVRGNAGLEEVHSIKHAGTLASIAEDKSVRQALANQNIGQFQAWIGEGVIPQVNTLTSKGKLARSHDSEIDKQLSAGLAQAGGEFSGTALNLARAFSGANDLSGARSVLGDIFKSLSALKDARPEADAANIAIVQAHLRPKPVSFFGRIARVIIHPVEAFTRATTKVSDAIAALKNDGAITDATSKMLTTAVNLRKGTDQAQNAVFLRSAGNAGLTISSNLGILTAQMKAAQGNLPGLKPRDVIVMCASGKDRTAAATHNQSSIAVAAATGSSLVDASKALVAGGHSAQQAGGVYSCGSAAGCFGTRIDNGWGMGNVLNAAATGYVTHKYQAGRAEGSLEATQVGLIEYASHGTRDHHHVSTKGDDLTPAGYEKETDYQGVVAARKEVAAVDASVVVAVPSVTQANVTPTITIENLDSIAEVTRPRRDSASSTDAISADSELAPITASRSDSASSRSSMASESSTEVERSASVSASNDSRVISPGLVKGMVSTIESGRAAKHGRATTHAEKVIAEKSAAAAGGARAV